jgi:hypothetical protein
MIGLFYLMHFIERSHTLGFERRVGGSPDSYRDELDS